MLDEGLCNVVRAVIELATFRFSVGVLTYTIVFLLVRRGAHPLLGRAGASALAVWPHFGPMDLVFDWVHFVRRTERILKQMS
jgi:hypothetical protein